jgi:hypothetical protein
MPAGTPVTGAQAMAMMGELFAHVFPDLTPM